MKTFFNYVFCALTALGVVSCTDLEEKALDGTIPEGGQSGVASLGTVVGNVAGLHNEWNRNLGMQEMPGDAMAGPTRGGDWDDNAALRQIHAHTWAPDHPWVLQTYNVLMNGVYNADLVLGDSAQSADHAAAKLLKAYFYFHMITKFGQVPYRDSYTVEALSENPMVYTRSEAFDKALGWAEEALAALPEKTAGGADVVSKDAARMLLAKLHLNKAVFKAEPGTTAYTHDAADMTAVIDYVNALTSTLNTATTDGSSYWANFDKDNDTSNELIWTLKVKPGASDSRGYTGYYWRMGQHYNQTPGGWNGPVMVGEYYDYFLENGVADGGDPRATWSTPDIVTRMGNSIGVQRGQMYKPGGTDKVLDRKGNDLVYTKEVPLVVLDPVAIESAGYRTIKYLPDDFDNANADYVIYRMADALLMRAEAALRGGSGGNAQTDLDAIRSRVGLGSITASLDNVYAERARELWWEGHRRTDMVRFGTFLSAKELKPTESDAKYLLFPMPADALLNPNLTQNPGY